MASKKPIKWNPDEGDCCQGDVILFRIPDNIKLNTSDEIAPINDRLILAEGEVTGHHHAIGLAKYLPQATAFHDEAAARAATVDVPALKKTKTGTAKMYRDTSAVTALVRAGEIESDRLAIGVLVVADAPVTLTHDEHDAICIPVGRYYVGGQREMDAAEERRVQD
jgi:hypothetical protein